MLNQYLLKNFKKNSDGLYINAIFDSQQRWIWTSNRLPREVSAWVVYFGDGNCNYDHFYCGYHYVRAVRS